MNSRSWGSCEETVLGNPVEVAQLRMFVAKALALETGHLASRGLAHPKPPASQTPSRAARFGGCPFGGCPSVVSIPGGPVVPLPQGANR
jgi:hypothetical protein